MRRASAFLLCALLPVLAGTATVGTAEMAGMDPFCSNWSSGLRYQVIATKEEIGTALEIETIHWHHTATGDTTATFENFNIYLAYCPNDVLSTVFVDNYVPNSKTLVYYRDNLEMQVYGSEWFSLELDSPFWYNGQDNLILEVTWAGGAGSIHNYLFNTPYTPCSLKAPTPDGPTGFLSSMRCQFMLEGTLMLQPATFGSIKVMLGSDTF